MNRSIVAERDKPSSLASQIVPPSRRIDSVQVLRALAAVLVLFCHGAAELDHSTSLGWHSILDFVVEKGLFGVDIFFVISGFIMTRVIEGRATYKGRAFAFMSERLIRIIPLYWLVTILAILVAATAPVLKHHNDYTFGYVLKSLFFFPAVNPTSGAPEPALGLGWTLDYEMFFYLILTVLIFFHVKRLNFFLSVVIVSLVVIGKVVRLPKEDVVYLYWTHTLLLEFLIGCLLAHLRANGVVLGAPVRLSLAAIGVVWWLVASPPLAGEFSWRGLVWGVPAALIFASLTMGGRQAQYPALMIAIGNSSYSLYLTHLFVMRLVSVALAHLSIKEDLRIVLFSVCFPLCALLIAMMSYRYFEVPIVRLGRRIIFKGSVRDHIRTLIASKASRALE